MSEIKVFLAGDSTMSYYQEDVAPRTGWGQVFHEYFKEELTIINKASSGRSTKSFIDEKRLAAIADEISENDYLFIQFGHNDQKSDEERHTEPFGSYKAYLRQYLEIAREKHAFPVLITPVQRRSFNLEGELEDTHGQYPNAMKELAEECNVPLIDLAEKSKALLEKLGSVKSKQLYLWYSPGEQANYPDGVQDDTHFSKNGANQIAMLIIAELKILNLTLSSYIKESVQ